MSTPSGHGGKTSPTPRNKYFSEIFSQSHIKHTYNIPKKDFKSIKRPWEVEKFKLDRKIFSGTKIKKELVRGIRTHDLSRINFKILSTTPHKVNFMNGLSIFNFIIKKLKFSRQKDGKTHDFKRIFRIRNMAKIEI